MPGFIADGFEENGFVAETAQLHEAVAIRYRPMTADEAAEVQGLIQHKKDIGEFGAAESLYHKTIADKVTWWDLKNPMTTKVVEITPDNVKRLHPALATKLSGIVMGWRPTDVNPNWDSEKKKEVEALRKKAEEEGRNFGNVKNEADEKN